MYTLPSFQLSPIEKVIGSMKSEYINNTTRPMGAGELHHRTGSAGSTFEN